MLTACFLISILIDKRKSDTIKLELHCKWCGVAISVALYIVNEYAHLTF